MITFRRSCQSGRGSAAIGRAEAIHERYEGGGWAHAAGILRTGGKATFFFGSSIEI